MARRSTSPVDNFSSPRLREFRHRAGVTADELATAAAVLRTNLVAFETGSKRPGFATVIALADALGIDPLELTTADPDRYTLADLRLRARLTRNELAAAIGVSYATWYHIEQGLRGLTDAVAQRAAEALDVSVDTLRLAHRTGCQAANLRGHPLTTRRHFALRPTLEPSDGTRPASATWTRRRVDDLLRVAGLDPADVTITTDPERFTELTGIHVGADTHGLTAHHTSTPTLYIDPLKAGTRNNTERLIAHEIGHLRWPSLGHRPGFFERVQQLLDAARVGIPTRA